MEQRVNCLNCGKFISSKGKRGKRSYSSKKYCSSKCQYRDRKAHLMLKKDFSELYEKRTYDKVRYKESNGLLRNICLTHLKAYYEQCELIQSGKNIPRKKCKYCFITKDVTGYYVDLTYKYARRNSCKGCDRIVRKNSPQYNKRIKSEKTFIDTVGTTILGELTKHNQQYSYIFRSQLWNEIKEYLGYTKQDLIEHFEEQFEDWMKWGNNGRMPVGKIKQQHWQMDHIKPRRQFKYTSVSDTAFIECWSLNNLRPVDSVDNHMKG